MAIGASPPCLGKWVAVDKAIYVSCLKRRVTCLRIWIGRGRRPRHAAFAICCRLNGAFIRDYDPGLINVGRFEA